MAHTDEVIIRPAKPQYEEGLIYARLFDKTAEGFLTSTLGKNAYEIIAEAFVHPDNDCSFENAAFVEFQNRIIGMVSAYSASQKQRFRKTISGNRRTPLYTIARGILSRFLGPKGKDDYYIQAIIVDETMRGKGIGSSLMEYIEEAAIAVGAKTLSLDVAVKNKKAVNLYMRQGMIVDSVWPNIPFVPHVFTRMTKEL